MGERDLVVGRPSQQDAAVRLQDPGIGLKSYWLPAIVTFTSSRVVPEFPKVVSRLPSVL